MLFGVFLAVGKEEVGLSGHAYVVINITSRRGGGVRVLGGVLWSKTYPERGCVAGSGSGSCLRGRRQNLPLLLCQGDQERCYERVAQGVGGSDLLQFQQK